jgi:hypothetical protein
MVSPSFPAKTIPELIAYAKTNPVKLNIGGASPPATTHVDKQFQTTHDRLRAGTARSCASDGDRFLIVCPVRNCVTPRDGTMTLAEVIDWFEFLKECEERRDRERPEGPFWPAL